MTICWKLTGEEEQQRNLRRNWIKNWFGSEKKIVSWQHAETIECHLSVSFVKVIPNWCEYISVRFFSLPRHTSSIHNIYNTLAVFWEWPLFWAKKNYSRLNGHSFVWKLCANGTSTQHAINENKNAKILPNKMIDRLTKLLEMLECGIYSFAFFFSFLGALCQNDIFICLAECVFLNLRFRFHASIDVLTEHWPFNKTTRTYFPFLSSKLHRAFIIYFILIWELMEFPNACDIRCGTMHDATWPLLHMQHTLDARVEFWFWAFSFRVHSSSKVMWGSSMSSDR